MKRSKALTLLLMGSMALGTSACGENSKKDDIRAFNSIAECRQSGAFSEAECRKFWVEAKKQTPVFSSKEECEKTFGAEGCEKNKAGSTRSGWSPFFTGYLMGRFLSGGSMMHGSSPLFRTPSTPAGSYVSSWGETVSPDSKGKVAPNPNIRKNIQHNAKPKMERKDSRSSSSKGGFGSSSRKSGS